jgi:hypothetical protein
MDSREPPHLHEPAGDLSEPGDVPAAAVWTMVAVIVLLAAVGTYKGFVSVRPGAPGSSLLSPDSLTTGKPVDAAPAVPLPRNPEWSTLNGPQILPPPSAKPASKPPALDATQSDDAPDAAAAAQADAPTDDATTAKDATPDDKAAPPAETPPADRGPQTP